jgi:hypothetical protein
MLYMVFIILQLARESKAGKFGTFVLLLALGFGLLGFAAKSVIKYIKDHWSKPRLSPPPEGLAGSINAPHLARPREIAVGAQGV